MLKRLKAEPPAYLVRGVTNIFFLDKTLLLGRIYTNFVEGFAPVMLEEPLTDLEVEIASTICTPAGVRCNYCCSHVFF